MAFFWTNRISGDTKAHGGRGVSNATDFVGAVGDPIHAPFTGKVTYRWFKDAGWRIQIENSRWICQLGHAMGNGSGGSKGIKPAGIKTGTRLWRTKIGKIGVTGDTNGPHVHAVIYDKKTGKRYSFAEWLIMRKGIRGVGKNIRDAVKNGKVKPI